jgi:iron complex outermembrane receptor protein
LGQGDATAQWPHLFTFRRTDPDGTTRDFAGTHGNCDVTNCIDSGPIAPTSAPSSTPGRFASIRNLFDRLAPLDPLTYGQFSFNPLDYAGAVGRFYSLGIKYRFF